MQTASQSGALVACDTDAVHSALCSIVMRTTSSLSAQSSKGTALGDWVPTQFHDPVHPVPSELGRYSHSHPVTNELGRDVQTASQSGVRTPRCDTCRVAAVRGDWAFGTGLHAVTLAALRQYAVTG